MPQSKCFIVSLTPDPNLFHVKKYEVMAAIPDLMMYFPL